MNVSVFVITNGISFFITVYLLVINYNFFDYLPKEFTSGSGTNIEATIQHIKAAKMIASVFVILRRKAFFIKNNFSV